MNIFYVYEHWRPDLNLPFYVGKGKAARAYSFKKRNKYHCNIRDKLERIGLVVEVKLVFSGLSEKTAFLLEKDRIAHWRGIGVRLANRTDGGEGISGFKPTKKQLKNMCAVAKLTNSRPEVRAKLRAAANKYWSDPAKYAQHAASLAKSVRSLEVRTKLRNKTLAALARPGFKAERAAKAKAALDLPGVYAKRAAALRKTLNKPEVHAKRVVAIKRMLSDPVVRAKISRSMKAYQAAKKQRKEELLHATT